MNQTSFNLVAYVYEVVRITSNRVKVRARGRVGEGVHLSFSMDTHEIDTPRVNDDILVTITTPAPSDGGPPA